MVRWLSLSFLVFLFLHWDTWCSPLLSRRREEVEGGGDGWHWSRAALRQSGRNEMAIVVNDVKICIDVFFVVWHGLQFVLDEE